MAGTIEEKIYHRQIFKQFLTNRVLKDPKQQRFFKTNHLHELFSLTEGEKEKTESSAIFAGTGSEIKLGVKKENVESEKKSSQESSELCNTAGESIVQRKGEQSENMKTSKILCKKSEKIKKKSSGKYYGRVDDCSEVINPSQVEKMKELARLLSQMIGKEKKNQVESKGFMTKEGSSQNKESRLDIGDSNITPLNDVKVKVDKNKRENENIGKLASESSMTEINFQTENNETVKALEQIKDFHPEDMTTYGTENSVKDGSGVTLVSKILEKDRKDSKSIDNILLKKSNMNNDKNIKDQGCKWQSDVMRLKSESSTERSHHKGKHKKKDKDRKEKHKESRKGKKFEGERIQYLVKKRKYKKTEEEKEEKELSKSQDQYVLEKLFHKSGIQGALSHDAIMNSNDPDYLLVEAEAERVAKEALKAVRASRSHCFRSHPVGSETALTAKTTPKFGNKKSKVFNEIPSVGGRKIKNENYRERKIPMFSGDIAEMDEMKNINDDSIKEEDGNKHIIPLSNEQGVGSSGMLSSSELLSRMRQRNKGLALESEDEDETDYNPDYPSTATLDEVSLDPEVQENIDLLADIRNFVAFQAEIDGQASTQEILSRFQERLPPSQTPFFKALLTQICNFHRDNSGQGIWSLKGEFR